MGAITKDVMKTFKAVALQCTWAASMFSIQLCNNVTELNPEPLRSQ